MGRGEFGSTVTALVAACAMALWSARRRRTPRGPSRCSSSTGRRTRPPTRASRDPGDRRRERLRGRRDRRSRADLHGEPGRLPRRRVPQHRRRAARRHPGGGARGLRHRRRRLRRHRQHRPGRAGQRVLHDADRRAPERLELDDATSEQVVVAGDRVHPATRDLPLVWNRTDVWYQWNAAADRHGPHGRSATARRTPAPVTASARTAPTSRSPGARTSATAARSTWAWAARPRPSARSACARTCSAPSSGAPASSAATARRASTPTTRATRLVQAGPTANGHAVQRRVARPRHRAQRLGASTSAAATAGPTPSAARSSARRRCRASSTTRTRTSGSAAARSTCGTRRPTTGRSTAASRAPARSPSTATARRRGERTDEANHKLEWGLLGIALSPDFMQTGHVYLQYFPSFNPSTTPPGLGEDRRISKISRPRISRFTLNLNTKQLNLDSEVRIFEYDAQVFSCCHVGGGMGFDSDGNLYVTTGDTNSSQGTGGYSGNNPDARCPTGPDQRRRARTAARPTFSYQDARRTAGNTNDYNGKMLRIRPIATSRTARRRRSDAGSTYTIPGDDAPERPEPVQRHRGRRRPGQARDLRHGPAQPVAAVDRPADGHPVLGLGRPRRRLAERRRSARRRTRTRRRSRTPATTAGPTAWATRRPTATALPGNIAAHRQPARLRARRPGHAAAPTAGTTATTSATTRRTTPASTELPHATGTGMDAGKVRPNNFWWGRGNPGALNGCPQFPRDRGPENAPNYGATPTRAVPVRRGARRRRS